MLSFAPSDNPVVIPLLQIDRCGSGGDVMCLRSHSQDSARLLARLLRTESFVPSTLQDPRFRVAGFHQDLSTLIQAMLSIKIIPSRASKVLLKAVRSPVLLGKYFQKENKHPHPNWGSLVKSQESCDAVDVSLQAEGIRGTLAVGEPECGLQLGLVHHLLPVGWSPL